MKNASIKEGQTSKQFGTLNYLRVNLYNSEETCDWVPEDERQRTTKHIRENGEYLASNETDYQGNPYYAFEEVTVDIEGDVVGIDPDDGNEYYIYQDEETGQLIEDVLPSSIVITIQPTKKDYYSGEVIDTTGMVVKAYKEDGSLWEGDGYPGGVIPTSELTIEPTVASGEGSGEESDIYVIDTPTGKIRAIKIYTGDITQRLGAWGTFVYSNFSLGTYDLQGQYSGASIHPGSTPNVTPIYMYLTMYNASLYEYFCEPFEIMYHIYPEYTIYGYVGRNYTKGWHKFDFVNFENYNSVIPHSTVDPLSVADDHFVKEGSMTVTVKWHRPKHSKELTDTFDVDVSAGQSSSGSDAGEHEGGGGGHSF